MKLRTVDSLLPEMNDGDLRAPVPRSLGTANSEQFNDVFFIVKHFDLGC